MQCNWFSTFNPSLESSGQPLHDARGSSQAVFGIFAVLHVSKTAKNAKCCEEMRIEKLPSHFFYYEILLSNEIAVVSVT